MQVIQEAAKVASHLTVFQRTPNWCAPLQNAPISEADGKEIADYLARNYGQP